MAAFVGSLRRFGGLRRPPMAAFVAQYYPLVLQRFLSKAAKAAKYF
jgi:hypothetical protein